MRTMGYLLASALLFIAVAGWRAETRSYANPPMVVRR